jgi:AcrR family transcriptional regulator
MMRRSTRRRRGARRTYRHGDLRRALLDAGIALARDGGPDAVVLREATRRAGVVPNAAYRHFADRDALLAAVREEAIGQLARRMAEGMNQVRAGAHTPTGARLRIRAVGQAYLEFARTEPGLFETAFTATDHPPAGDSDQARPLEYLQGALDDLVRTGLLEPARRPGIEYPTWATVHGLAVLLRGPLQALPDGAKLRLEAETLAFIGTSLT